MWKQCAVCGEHISHLKESALFCSDKCRDEYHNTTRKIERKVKRVEVLLAEIAAFSDDIIYSEIALKSLYGIQERFDRLKPHRAWTCGYCYQVFVGWPTEADSCLKCGGYEWIVSEK